MSEAQQSDPRLLARVYDDMADKFGEVGAGRCVRCVKARVLVFGLLSCRRSPLMPLPPPSPFRSTASTCRPSRRCGSTLRGWRGRVRRWEGLLGWVPSVSIAFAPRLAGPADSCCCVPCGPAAGEARPLEYERFPVPLPPGSVRLGVVFFQVGGPGVEEHLHSCRRRSVHAHPSRHCPPAPRHLRRRSTSGWRTWCTRRRTRWWRRCPRVRALLGAVLWLRDARCIIRICGVPFEHIQT